MHNNWEEMIPFYIAGTLPKLDTNRLESHLATCDDCRTALDDWRSIADAVRSDAAAQMRDLPPISAQVMSVVNQESFARHSAATGGLSLTPRTGARYRSASVTLVAAVFTVILFGGLLAFMVLRGTHPQQGDVALLPTATPSAVPTQEVSASQSVPSLTPFLSPQPPQITPATVTNQPQIIVIEPSVTPTFTPSPSPTLVFATRAFPTVAPPTPIPLTLVRPTQIIPTALLLTNTPEMFAQSLIVGMGGGPACTIQAAVPNSVVNLYAGPGTDYAVVKSFSNDDQLTVLGKSDNGWYQAQYAPDSSQWVGWVRQELVYTSGLCDGLPAIAASDYLPGFTPTPSVIPPIVDPPFVTIASDGINLRSGPGTNYPIMGSASLGDTYHVEALTGSGNQLWYLITIPGARSAWVYATLVQLSPPNAIIAPAATIPPTPMPTASAMPPTPAPTLTPNVAAGRWSQTVTILSTTCAGGATGMSTTTSVSLIVNADSIVLSYADAGTPFTLIRSGDRIYMGGYSTPNTSVNVTLTFTSSLGYTGNAVILQNDGCTVQAAWNGLFQSS